MPPQLFGLYAECRPLRNDGAPHEIRQQHPDCQGLRQGVQGSVFFNDVPRLRKENGYARKCFNCSA